MKMVMDKVDIIVKLKERISETRSSDTALANQLEGLLESIMKDSKRQVSSI